MSLSEQEGTKVTLSYRKEVFSRNKELIQMAIEQAMKSCQVHVIFNSTVKEIRGDQVILTKDGKEGYLPEDYVFVFAGGELPSKFLKKIGIEIETKHGER